MLKLDLDAAMDALQKAVKYMPNHIGTWHALAWCQIIKNDLDGAKTSFDEAMKIDRNFGETHGGLAVIAYVQGDKETAKTESRKAVLLDPMSFSGRFAESLLLQDTDPEAAREMISNIMQSSIGDDGKSLQEILSGYMSKQTFGRRNH
jgi:Flp pilus assembly protein TadD